MKPKLPAYRSGSSALTPLCVIAFLFTVMFVGRQAHSQRVGMAPTQPQLAAPPGTSGLPSNMDAAQLVLGNKNLASSKDLNRKEDNCFLPPLNELHIATVGVTDLQVPSKVQQEFEDGCAAVKSRKMADAENHLRKVVKQYEKYAAAWVLLGQVLEVQQKSDEARDSCSRPLTTVSNYLPAYLCLTDIAARLKNWDETLKLSIRALEIDPTSSASAYAYNATANLKLHHLAEAEKSALRASEIDSKHSEPRLLYLLAQIYAAKGDLPNTAAQLRQYLKFATDPDDAIVVKGYLAKLEGPSGK
jgi:tetratricopeptide (TPR) repeat protein